MQLQAEQLSKKGMQLTADKAAVESTLSLKEEEVRLHHSIALISHVHQRTGPFRPLHSFQWYQARPSMSYLCDMSALSGKTTVWLHLKKHDISSSESSC